MIDTLHMLWTRYSTWVVLLWNGGTAYWLSLPPESQAAVIALFPWFPWMYPLIGFIAFLVARGLPQPPRDVPMRR